MNRNSLYNQKHASSFLTVLLRTVTWTLVGGPAAATISLVKGRDEYMLGLRATSSHEPNVDGQDLMANVSGDDKTKKHMKVENAIDQLR